MDPRLATPADQISTCVYGGGTAFFFPADEIKFLWAQNFQYFLGKLLPQGIYVFDTLELLSLYTENVNCGDVCNYGYSTIL